jgi:hypothetical protein
VAGSREAASPIIYRKADAMAGPMSEGFSERKPLGLSGGSDHRSDAVIHWGRYPGYCTLNTPWAVLSPRPLCNV